MHVWHSKSVAASWAGLLAPSGIARSAPEQGDAKLRMPC